MNFEVSQHRTVFLPIKAYEPVKRQVLCLEVIEKENRGMNSNCKQGKRRPENLKSWLYVSQAIFRAVTRNYMKKRPGLPQIGITIYKVDFVNSKLIFMVLTL